MGRCREGRNADATVRGPARWCVAQRMGGEEVSNMGDGMLMQVGRGRLVAV